MSLKEVQKDVEDWVSQYKIGYFEPHQILARLIEEVGELAREINHLYGPKKKKSSEETKEMSDEMADIIFTLCCLANSKGIDLDESWQRMMDKIRTRDDKRFEKR
jgi:NTP pyrophosphatase (non-canonical NTP hydrolase)